MEYLPSKKIITSLLLVLIAAGTGFYLFKFKKPSPKDKLQNSLVSIAKNASEIDSDKDGLKNWEEVLWKTDINNPDSDSDGYPDKQETEMGYSPIDALSNEKTGKKNQITFSSDSAAFSGNMNLTEELAKNISAEIIKSGGNVQPDLSNPLSMMDKNTEQGIAEFIASLNVRISESELKVSKDNISSSIAKYVQEYINAQLPMPDFKENNDGILIESIQTKDFRKIDEFINYFERTIANLKTIITPLDFLQIHKRKIELLIAEQKIYKNIKETDKDPLKAILGIQQYEKISEENMNLINDFSSLVSKYF